jgi:lysophospholipid acyltransferase (LPLAT)-like uncharacterized protein
MHEKKWYRRLEVGDIPALPRLLARAICLWHNTCRISVLGEEHVNSLLQLKTPILLTTWHFAFPTIVYYFRQHNAAIMVSRSRDGEWIARVLDHLGYRIARGSPGKGGARALREMLAQVQNGAHAGLLADGSQGPPCIAQKGILLLARYAQAPLLPVSIAARPCYRFRSWDRTVLAKPFSHIALAYGPPIWVDRHVSSEGLEEIRQDLENRLNHLTRMAEEHLKR